MSGLQGPVTIGQYVILLMNMSVVIGMHAMSSYGLLQGLTGVCFDAVDHILYIDSKIGDFKSFISTEKGFGNVGLKDGKPFFKMVYGNLDVKKVLVSRVEMRL